MNKWFWCLVVVVGIVWIVSTSMWMVNSFRDEPTVKKECLSGYVTIEGPYGNRLVMGDMEICGVDLEMGNIIGPSKLYNSGDPL